MVHLRLRPAQSLRFDLKQKLIPKIKLSNFLSLPENEFARTVKEIESDPLFIRLMYPSKLTDKVIAYQRFPRTGIASGFYELKEEIARDHSVPDIQTLVYGKEEIIQICRELGREKFNQYFLYNEEGLSFKEIAKNCALPLAKVKKVIELINEVSIQEQFFIPSTITPGEKIHYTKIAAIEREGEKFSLNYYFPHLARGRYVIDYGKIEKLKAQGFFTSGGLKPLEHLLKKLELVNLRKTALFQICEKIIELQVEYLKSGDPAGLKPFTQSELAKEIGVNPSTISRLIRNKSVENPLGREVPLKGFFQSQKKVKLDLIREIFAEEKESISDEKVKEILRKKYGLEVSRRSITAYRKELKIGSSFQRKVGLPR